MSSLTIEGIAEPVLIVASFGALPPLEQKSFVKQIREKMTLDHPEGVGPVADPAAGPTFQFNR